MGPAKSQARIAILCDYFEQPFQANVVRLCLKELAARDCQAIIINGNNIARSTLYQDPGVFLFDYARDSFDGIIALGGSISSYSGAANTQKFLSRFSPTPIVNIALDLPGFSTAMTDNAQGVRDIMEHLVVDHGYSKILFLAKAQGEGDGDMRLEAFEASLVQFGLGYDPNLIVPGVYYERPSDQASYIFDQKRMKPGRDFDAIFAVDSYSVSLLYPHLVKRGFSAPKDFAIAAFDLPITYDFPFRITCSAQNFELIAKSAIDSLFTKISGKDEVSSVIVKPFFVIGDSCGCTDPLESISHMSVHANAAIPEENVSIHKVVSELKAYLYENQNHAFKHQIERLVGQFESFFVEDTESEKKFLEDKLLTKEIQYGSAGLLVRILKLCGPHHTLTSSHGILLQQIKKIRSEILSIAGQFALQIHHSNSVTRDLLSASYQPGKPEQIARVFIEALDQIYVKTSMCYVFPTETNVSVYFRNKGGVVLEEFGRPSPSRLTDPFFKDLLGHGFFIFYPLFFETKILGILGMELPFEFWHDSVAIETLRSLFSNTLYTAALIQEKQDSLERLKQTQDQLIHVEKLSILAKLVQELSHEINTPIGNNLTAAGFIKDLSASILRSIGSGAVSKSQLLRQISLIGDTSQSLLTDSKKMANIINNFQMLMVNDPSQRRSSMYIADFLSELVKATKKSRPEHMVSLRIGCDSKTRVTTYPNLLREIFAHLLDNALTHAFDKGRSGKIEIAISTKGSNLEIIFGDNGIGLRDEQKPTIFEPFSRTMRGDSGPGLGLYVVYSLVVLKLEGSIELIEGKSPGLAFKISLPIVDLD